MRRANPVSGILTRLCSIHKSKTEAIPLGCSRCSPAHVASSLWHVASGGMAVHAAPLQGQQAVRVQPFAGVMRVKLERLEALERTRLQKLAEAELARAEVERLQEDAKRLQAEEAAKRQLARCASLANREHKELGQENQFIL